MPVKASSALSWLEIDLPAVAENYLSLQKRLVKGTDCAAVVKADAYGLGAAQVAPALLAAGCRHFYVAHAQEGLAVRAALGDADAQVYAFHGTGGIAEEELLAARIIPVLNGIADVEAYAALAKRKEKRLPAVLHIDTGMRRLGLAAGDIAKLDRGWLKAIDLRYVMSHLACADEPAHEMNRRQLKDFVAQAESLGLPCRKSFANSSGIFLGQDFHFDQARPGCALYGINPQPENKNPMRQPAALKARILQIRDGLAGETVGYSATYKLARPERLATISAGYADGLLRSTTERGMVYVGGRACPLRGRVSMDTVVADISGVPEKDIDGTAEILGAHRTADDAAREAGTIGYEILTGLGRRYERIYRDAS